MTAVGNCREEVRHQINATQGGFSIERPDEDMERGPFLLVPNFLKDQTRTSDDKCV